MRRSLRLSRELDDGLKEVAQAERRSVNAEIEVAIGRHVDAGDAEEDGGGGILDVRLSGPAALVDEALAALRLVLEVADVSRPYTNRRGGGQRVYVRALGLSPEARRFLER